MRIGIVLETSRLNTGTYYYSIALLNALRDYGKEHEYFIFCDDSEFPVDHYRLPNWSSHLYTKSDEGRWHIKIARWLTYFGFCFLKTIARGRHKILCNYKLDLVICPSTTLAAWWCDLRFVVAIHDVWHRHKLPGTTLFGEPFRDLIWRRAARSSEVVLAESEMGKKQIIETYHIPKAKVYVLPTCPAPFVWNYDDQRTAAVRMKYMLPECYVFYPGVFAPAKNQESLIRAIGLIHKKHNLNLHAVFAGPMVQYHEVMLNLARRERIEHLIHFLGHVPDEDMAILYKQALSLVMPSYIGPTNMPIWEAFAVGCPVISSNSGDMANQVSNAGLLFNPSSVDELCDCILQIYNDKELRSVLIKLGFEKSQQLRPENWAYLLLKILQLEPDN